MSKARVAVVNPSSSSSGSASVASSQKTFFDVFDLAPKFHLDGAALEARYFERSKQVHPDRFAKASARERMQALQQTTLLNDAYRVLKNDGKRAEYLLKLEGLDVTDERAQSVKPDPELLLEMMELNEQLTASNTTPLIAKVDALISAAWATADEGFYAFEKGDRAILPRVAQAIVAVRYYTRFRQRAAGLSDGESS
jgi:molecular chaperone HscB